MKLLEQAISERGQAIGTEVLLVDSFLNHQVDVELMREIGEEFARHFEGRGIDRVATIESSGIAPAAFTALALHVPLLIMKKQASKIMAGNLLSTTVISFTKGKEYSLTAKWDFLPKGENVLFIDDFLAYGEAALGAKKLIEQAGATLAGVGIVIEKSFQKGPERLREAGIDLYSLARIRSMADGKIEFMED
ncbi:MAG: xanthine phosphoribosyltransferase [Clostridiales bacterium]|nr:xanthine phosphoribosyltransferase [Clostridiales bacterium]